MLKNRIPSDFDAFQEYINRTDDYQSGLDSIGFSVYPRDENGKTDYNDRNNIIEKKGLPAFYRWDWTENESRQWTAFRKRYNGLFEKYLASKGNAAPEL